MVCSPSFAAILLGTMASSKPVRDKLLSDKTKFGAVVGALLLCGTALSYALPSVHKLQFQAFLLAELAVGLMAVGIHALLEMEWFTGKVHKT